MGSAKQPGDEFLRHIGSDDLIGGSVSQLEEMRQVVGARVASHPDRYGPVTRVVGQHDQVTAGLEFAVGQPPGPGLGVRDSYSVHALKCPPGGPVLPGSKEREIPRCFAAATRR